MNTMKIASAGLLVGVVLTSTTNAFVVPNGPRSPATSVSMSIFDDLQLIFSDEGKKNRAEYDRREKEEMEAAQRQIIERRRNPEKMRKYDAGIMKNREKLAEERQVYDFQNKVEKGYDPITDWKRLRAEGKIKIGKDLKRDEGSRRLGSEGLIDVRVDERMPYIDQGYVSEDADVMGQVCTDIDSCVLYLCVTCSNFSSTDHELVRRKEKEGRLNLKSYTVVIKVEACEGGDAWMNNRNVQISI